jgi:hypothetical protein
MEIYKRKQRLHSCVIWYDNGPKTTWSFPVMLKASDKFLSSSKWAANNIWAQ